MVLLAYRDTVILESGCTGLRDSQLGIGTDTQQFAQCVEILIPFNVPCHAPDRSCLPCSLLAGHFNVKPSFFPRESIEMRKIVGPQD
jgi:hypothetical protein